MKAILMSIRPEWVADILNGEKTIEIRKKFPKDYVGWVYIYVTRDKKILSFDSISKNGKTYYDGFNDKDFDFHFFTITKSDIKKGWGWFASERNLNGTIIARFWCDKVDLFRCIITGNLKDGFFKAKPYCKVIEDGIANYNCDNEFEDILKNAQITNKELAQYLGDKREPYGGWYVFNAIHINDLEIFDKPKEISEFSIKVFPHRKDNLMTRYLTRAPQSFMFIEV